MAELVEMFVDELPDRIEHLQQLLATADWDALGRLAHQMKGACGSYGFDQLTPLAARVEQASRDGEPEQQILAAVTELSDAVGRTRVSG
jgi:HPt (histidine-containing phosphotransfer) domain-containing protein